MKKSKVLTILIITAVLFAFLPIRPVQAYVSVTTSTTITTNGTLTADLVVTNGATLTINSGVTITAACTDSAPYHSGADSGKVEIIIENGTLIADGVTFQGDGTYGCWRGIRILENGYAEITRSTINNARIGIEVYHSSSVISRNTISHIGGISQAESLDARTAAGIMVIESSSGVEITKNNITDIRGGTACSSCGQMDGGVAYGITATDSDNMVITDNTISSIYGGTAGKWLTDGAAGATGADGSSLENMDGQPGGTGGNGVTGGTGGDAIAIQLNASSEQSATILGNTISNLTGGNGQVGTRGGTGGRGGDGYSPPTTHINYTVTGGTGGTGGSGGNGGNGGSGGSAIGIRGQFISLTISDNQISSLQGGAGAQGGIGGTGGGGGIGGNGSSVYLAYEYLAGLGGLGGTGGNGGLTGYSGDGGTAIGVSLYGSTLTSFTDNTIIGLNGGIGATGLAGGTAGVGGNGGTGGQGASGEPYGATGGNGGNAGSGTKGGAGGDGGAVYGLFAMEVALNEITANTIAKLNAGIGGNGGNGASTGRAGGIGGLVGNYALAEAVAGNGGSGSKGGNGGDGGIAGFAFGIYAEGLPQAVTLVNNLIYDVFAPHGGAGGTGGTGGDGGRGGNGYSTGGNRPGGDGGTGGNGGNGGSGGENVYGLNLNNSGAIYLSSTSAPTKAVWMTNNTLALVYADDTAPAAGIGGVPGTGGIAGDGSVPGATGAPGTAGSNGNPGVRGESIGYFSGAYTNSTLYNNVVANLITPIPANSVGVYKHVNSVFSIFRYGNICGWQKAYGDSLVSIDKTGSISADPLFVDYTTEDYHLSAGSPCIDTGANDAHSAPSVDLDGVARPVGAVIDMGAYEYNGAISDENLNYIPLVLN